MRIGIRKDFRIEMMLDRLSELRTLQPDGSIAMSNLSVLDDFKSYLRTAVDIEGKTDAFVQNIVNTVMNLEQNMTEKSFLESCKRVAHSKINTIPLLLQNPKVLVSYDAEVV